MVPTTDIIVIVTYSSSISVPFVVFRKQVGILISRILQRYKMIPKYLEDLTQLEITSHLCVADPSFQNRVLIKVTKKKVVAC